MAKFASAKNECTHNVILGKLISLKHLRNYKSELVFCLKKKKPSKIFKSSSRKNCFSLMCMLLVQLTSMNVTYIM